MVARRSPVVRRLYPPPVADLAVEAVYTDLAWPSEAALPPDRPFVALNMVSSVDGRATLDGSAMGIGGAVDRALMMRLRTQADALLFGAGTLRADRVGKGVPDALEGVRAARGLAPQPLLALLTSSGDVPLGRALFAAPERVVVFVAEQTPAEAVAQLRARATVRVVGEERPDPAKAFRTLRHEYGVRHLLCESGPTLSGALLAANLLDELFLTLAPKLLSGDGSPLLVGPALRPPVPLTPRSLHKHEGELYLRYAVGSR